MIGALSQNGLLSAVFGPGVLRRAQDLDRGRTQPLPNQNENTTETTDTVEISTVGRTLGEGVHGARPVTGVESAQEASSSASVTKGQASGATLGGEKNLAPEEEKQVKELKKRDQEVRRHEQAHKGAAGGLASGAPKFEYETGPDGKQYAVGGEVSIDTSPVSGDPQATIRKMQQVRQAALAPGEPSSQDRAVAAQASAAEQQARAELAEKTKQTDQAAPSGGTPSITGATAPSTGPSHGAAPTSPYQATTSFAALIDITA